MKPAEPDEIPNHAGIICQHPGKHYKCHSSPRPSQAELLQSAYQIQNHPYQKEYQHRHNGH